jgi:RNA polymerase sigma-70 factor (ECF subfamily)
MSRNPANEALFKEWLETHRGIMFKVTQSFARTPTDAAELQQEIQIQLWNSLPAFTGKAKPSTWIYRVCLNTALAWHRSAARRKAGIDPEVDLRQLAVNATTPVDTLDQQEMLDKVYAAIRSMGDFDRALVLLMLDGLAYREIAEVIGMTENNVGVALTRARKRLATLMKGVIDELE